MLKRILAVACLLLASIPASRSQVVIREKMVINPKPGVLHPQESPSLDNLFAVNGAQIRTTVPGVTVNASLELNVTSVPSGTSVEIVVTAGSTSQVVRRLAKSCEGSITDESTPFPETQLTGCGPISATMTVFDRSAATTYCSSTFKTGTATANAGGPQATITLQTSLNNYDVVPPQAMNVTATVTISGVADPSYLQEGIHVTPGTSQILCDGQTIVDVVPYDANGNVYVACGAPPMATARLKAKGQYAYLRYGSQQDSIITFPVNAGFARIYLVFDTFFYDMPTGLDTAVIAVDMDGFKDTARVRLACEVLVDHLEIKTTDPIQYGGTGDLKVIASNAVGEEVYLNGSAQIDLFGSPETVNFLTTNGDTVPSPLLRVPYDDVRQGKIRLIANGLLEGGDIQAAQVDANVRRDYVYGHGTFNIEVGCTRIFADPDTVAVADTATLTFQYPITDTTFGDFLPDQLFEVSVASDSSQGLLLTEDGEVATMFLGKAQPIRYIAPSEIEGDLLLAHVVAAPTMQTGDGGGGGGGVARAGAGQGSEKEQDSHAQGYQLALAELQACAPEYVPVIGEEDFKILLGESMYYYVVEKDGKRRIKETTRPEFPEEGEGETIIKSASVWGDNPVTITGEEANIGKRLGVYWETQKPKPDGSGPLAPGLIRLVGRYWEPGSIYKAKLAATDEAVKSIVVEVKKPSILFSPSDDWNEGSYSTSIDVFGETVNIDDLIIEYAGSYGVPPQYIKGQMYQESNKTGRRFNPSYRYEPGKDFEFLSNEKFKNRYFRKGYPFVVGLNPPSMGGDLPGNHSNVRPYDYQRFPVTIAWYVGSRLDEYVQHKDDYQIVFLGGKVGQQMQVQWTRYFTTYRTPPLSLDDALASSLALTLTRTDLMVGPLRWDFDQPAQTRIMASYGIVQMTHYSVTDMRLNGFGKTTADKLPEHLNDNREIMPAYIERVLKDMKRVLGENAPAANWKSGFDDTWEEVAGWYNPLIEIDRVTKKKRAVPNESYGRDIMNNSRAFLPQR